MSLRYTWHKEPQPCPVCGKAFVDLDIAAEMEAACSPYGYIQCPDHFPEPELKLLKEFLVSLECVKTFCGVSGPVQDLPESASARRVGLAVILPLPLGHDESLPEQIMIEVQKWATERGWERFGMIVPADCPMLLLGLRRPSARRI